MAPSGLIRVTVVAGSRRADLALPADLPVAELLPELGRQVGVAADDLLPSVQLHRLDGTALRPQGGLGAQGVRDGAVLHLVAAGSEPPPRHDDVVEAVAEITGREQPQWRSATGRRATLVTGVALMASGAVALFRVGESAAPVAGVLAVVVISGAAVISRGRGDHRAAATVVWLGSGYAALTGLLAGGDHALLGPPLALAGLGALLAGLAGAAGLAGERALLIPPTTLGALGLALGLLLPGSGHAIEVVSALMAVAVATGSLLPWLALSLTRIRPQPPWRPGQAADPTPIDGQRLRVDLRLADQVLVGMQATVGLLLLLVAPVALTLGVAGAALALACCLVVILRIRQHLAVVQVAVGLMSGLGGLLVTAVAAIWQEPLWAPALAGGLVVGGVGVLASLLLPAGPSARRGWLGDLLESAALVALLPLLAVATGLLDAVQR